MLILPQDSPPPRICTPLLQVKNHCVKREWDRNDTCQKHFASCDINYVKQGARPVEFCKFLLVGLNA